MNDEELIEQFQRRQHAKKRSSRTGDRRASDLRQFAQWLHERDMTLTDVTTTDVEAYMLEVMEKYADKTAHARHDALSAFYGGFAASKGHVTEDPIEEFDASEYDALVNPQTEKSDGEAIVYVRPEEKEKMVQSVPAPKTRNQLLIRLMWQTGIRASEVTNLRVDHIDREKRVIEVYAEKTDEGRVVVYQPRLDTLLNAWLDGGVRASYPTAAESNRLFITRQLGRLRREVVNDVVKNAAHEAGVQEPLGEDAADNTRWRITAHTLRHGFAVQCLRNGIDIRRLSDLMGHSNLETTKKYLQVTDEQVIEAARQFGPGTEDVSIED